MLQQHRVSKKSLKRKKIQDRSHQWSTRPAHSPGRHWLLWGGRTYVQTDGRTDVRTYGLTDTLCENSDHYRPGLWSASWINIQERCHHWSIRPDPQSSSSDHYCLLKIVLFLRDFKKCGLTYVKKVIVGRPRGSIYIIHTYVKKRMW